MRAPVSWLREHAALPDDLAPRDLAAALVEVGMEVETVDVVGEGVTGPVLVGRVAAITELTEFRKPIRFCQVDVGAAGGGVRGIVCGATNFAVGDLVPVALPGAVLPGDFVIAARTTYGHVSDGMICSASELGLGDEYDGIMVLPPGSGAPGDDAASLLGIGEAVLDIAVTPDRGYCLSIRGLAREAATALGVDFRDPADIDLAGYPVAGAPAPRVSVEVPEACSQFTAVLITGVDPNVPSPAWLQSRLVAAGMRSISLAVDVTNYVMLELGQPLHAFDADSVVGGITVRRPRLGETLVTLDHVERTLDPGDVLIADDRGPIGLAGAMGGLESEISEATTSIILEAAHFAPEDVARMARRHKLPSEASRRFERVVDPALPWVASRRAAELLVAAGGGHIEGGTSVGSALPLPVVLIEPDLPARIAGAPIGTAEARGHLMAVGCTVTEESDGRWRVTAPSWRPDLRDPADVVEEVVRLYGYEKLPATLPSPPAGRGLTSEQRWRRAASRALAGAGFTEVLSYPFVGEGEVDALGITGERARAVKLANPLSDEQSRLRTTLLAGLLTVARRNLGRGAEGVSLYETGVVFLPGEPPAEVIRPGVSRPPQAAEIAALAALLPDQPHHVAAVIAGQVEAPGWWGAGRKAAWHDAVASAQVVAAALRVQLEVAAVEAERAPWHPGRCAELRVASTVVGYAGELHPRVVEALGLPPRSAAMECDLDALIAAAPAVVSAPAVSTFPVAKEDIALVVAEEVSAADVQRAVVAGAGELLESVRLFDEYRGAQVPEGSKSLAFALRFRAANRTLSDDEVAAARDAAVARAGADTGASLRAS
ncbi:MAG: phenylalanyl-tRNA synthetase beta chain [Actinomycetota bacterium]|nr:phenylalanyl-tRNA synthetase beta chain [Actinomycetota bacterium]